MTVVGGTTPKQHDGWMWDLTVPGNNDHDFYVLPAQTGNSHHTYHVVAGGSPVFVHNTNCGVDPIAQNIADHANGEAIRPDGNGTHYVRGVNPKALPEYVDGVINGEVPNLAIRYLRHGHVAYWDPDNGAVVIEDGGGGTVFTPKEGKAYFDDLK